MNFKLINRKMNFKNVKLGSTVWDKESEENFLIANQDDLELVVNNWENRFTGIEITQNNIGELLSDLDLVPSFYSSSKLKYRLFDNDNLIKPLCVFYGAMSVMNNSYFMKSSIGDEEFVCSFSDGNDRFHDFYCIKNRKKIHIRFVHELQNMIDFLQRRFDKLLLSVCKN
jgi:hypothetical protein